MHKSYRVLNIFKKAFYKLVQNFKLDFLISTRKIFNYNEIFILVYIAKSISFEVISVLNKKKIAAELIILLQPLKY